LKPINNAKLLIKPYVNKYIFKKQKNNLIERLKLFLNCKQTYICDILNIDHKQKLKLNYQETIALLYSKLPMFTRIGAAAYKPDIGNISQLCEVLDNPQKKIKTVHVAGTNGKGSTSHMLSSILQEAGYKVGLYTSPHLVDFRERIKINGMMISQDAVIDFVELISPYFDELNPSFFEVTVAMAFDYFTKQQVDVAIIEVGLGGRLDATNIINPLLSIITNISMDHQVLLGETLALIAGEKAGIIKPNTPVVVSEYQSEIADVFQTKAMEMQADITFAAHKYQAYNITNLDDKLEFSVCKNKKKYIDKIQIPIAASYQLKNCVGVVAAIDDLRKHYTIPKAALVNGFKNLIHNTNLIGRWQVLQLQPKVVLDVSHNVAGIEEVIKQLSKVNYQNLHWIIGMVADKDIDSIIDLLPNNALYYACQPNTPRGLQANLLCKKIQEKGLQVIEKIDAITAMNDAIKDANPNDLILVAGSCYILDNILVNANKHTKSTEK
jgi:dihydrofolate synthase/folylpolyglutamate synthase